MRPRPSAHFWALLIVAVAISGTGCSTTAERGYPLYEPQQPLRPPEQVARLFGPLAKIDDRDVTELGRAFDLAPGCHVLEVRHDFLEVDTAGAARPAEEQRYVFGAMMTAGYAYSIERTSGATNDTAARFRIGLRETAPDGTVTNWAPTNPTHAAAKCQAMRSVLQKE
jgi:hypothetical protein